MGRGILEFFCEKSRGPPTSQIRLMHDPSQIPKQKHLTLPTPPPKKPEVKMTDRKCCSHNRVSKREMANYVNFARRMRLPTLHFQLYDHIPTMASNQTSIISLGVQPLPTAISRTTSNLELRLSDCLRKVNYCSQWDCEAIRKFSDKYIVPEKLVAEYAEHLALIKMCKEKKKEETERERMERLKTGLDCTTPISCRP